MCFDDSAQKCLFVLEIPNRGGIVDLDLEHQHSEVHMAHNKLVLGTPRELNKML